MNFRPNPKPIPKEKKKFGTAYWNEIKRKSFEKKKVKNKPIQDKLDLWYRKIYDIAGGFCAESGRKLEFSNKHCAHILPKSRYPYFANDLRNGILLSWSYHAILDKGSTSQRKALNTWEYISLQRKMLLEEVGLEYSEEFWLNMSA